MVLDMKMPKIKGMDVLRRGKEIEKNIPVIILTGSIDVERYIKDLEDLGYTADDVLIKPVDLNQLLERINKRLQ